jgi:hypothetical protein
VKTGTTTPVAPADVTPEQLVNMAPDLPKYVNGLVRVRTVTAGTATSPTEGDAARTFGDFKLQGSNLNISDKIWYRGTGATVTVGQQFTEIVGISYLDFCTWGLSPRTLNYSHYLFEAIPYACLSLGFLADRFWNFAEHRVASPLVRGYVILVGVLFLFFLPFLMGLPTPASWYYFEIFGQGSGVRPWTWFPKWV